MKRYITRWALTRGIRVMHGEYSENGAYFCGSVSVRSKEAFETLEEAKSEARKAAQKRAKSLRAQANRLSDPTWEPEVENA